MQYGKIGISTAQLAGSFRKALALAAECQVTGVEVDLRSELPYGELTKTAVRQIRKWMEDYQLRLAAARFTTRSSLVAADNLERRLAAIRQSLSSAYELGARQLVLAGAVREVDADAESRQAIVDQLAPLCLWGERVGCRLVLQLERWEYEPTKTLLDALPESTVQLALHTGLATASGESISELTEQFAEHWGVVYAADGYRDVATRRFSPTVLGRGTVDFAEVAAILDGASYQDWWLPQASGAVDPIIELTDAVRFLQQQ